MEAQRNEPFDEPPPEAIPGISRRHVAAMEASDADQVWTQAGMHCLLLRTIGRRSGKEHKVALPFWRDQDGRHIVVASFAGAPANPAWYLNVLDRAANPEVLVRVQGGQYWAEAQSLEGADYERIWTALIADRPHYNDYQSRTTRQIPLVRLVEHPDG